MVEKGVNMPVLRMRNTGIFSFHYGRLSGLIDNPHPGGICLLMVFD
jgi:hypothetical protein